MLKKLFIVSTLFISTSIFAAEKAPVFSSPKTPIVVSHQNAEFVITLPSNPTTGFSWHAKSFHKAYIGIVGHKYVAPQNKKLIGAPGYEAWCFRVKKADTGTTHIVMQYARPWTKQGATESVFTVVVKNN